MAGKKREVSDRSFIDAAGVKTEKMEDASGARYRLLDSTAPDGGHIFEKQFVSDDPATVMFAIMGFHTKVGNVANSILNDKDAPGTPAEAAAACRDFIAGVEGGTWADRTGGVVRWDNDKLADAFIEWLTDAGKQAPARERVLARLASEEATDAQWAKQVRNNPPVVTIYKRLVGAVVRTADELLGGFDS